jgi:hypothetical protein
MAGEEKRIINLSHDSLLILEIRFFQKIGFLEPRFQKLFAGNMVKVWKRK